MPGQISSSILIGYGALLICHLSFVIRHSSFVIWSGRVLQPS
ncbi:hypothetical protein [Coleofasciculus sp. F4-SAH-05]